MVRTAAGIVGSPFRAKDELLSAGLWSFHDEDGFVIHDFLVYNPSKAQREAATEQARERKDRWRRGKRSHAGTEGVTDDGGTPTTPPPSPLNTSLSSSEPCVGEPSEEDEIRREAEKRLANRVGKPIVDREAWLNTAMQRIREERRASEQATLNALTDSARSFGRNLARGGLTEDELHDKVYAEYADENLYAVAMKAGREVLGLA